MSNENSKMFDETPPLRFERRGRLVDDQDCDAMACLGFLYRFCTEERVKPSRSKAVATEIKLSEGATLLFWDKIRGVDVIDCDIPEGSVVHRSENRLPSGNRVSIEVEKGVIVIKFGKTALEATLSIDVDDPRLKR